MIKLLIFLLLATPCFADRPAICGGGFTDKNGDTWDWTGSPPDCCYQGPRKCKECYSAPDVLLDSPSDSKKCHANGKGAVAQKEAVDYELRIAQLEKKVEYLGSLYMEQQRIIKALMDEWNKELDSLEEIKQEVKQ